MRKGKRENFDSAKIMLYKEISGSSPIIVMSVTVSHQLKNECRVDLFPEVSHRKEKPMEKGKPIFKLYPIGFTVDSLFGL